jgi:predicted  nucleic acid-binding Zn-ribbon protein
MGFLSKVFKPLSKIVGVILKPISKLLKNWLTPDIPDKEGLKVQRVGSNLPIPIVYGRRKLGGVVVDKNVTDVDGGAKNDTLHMLMVFCYGEVDAIEEIYFGDTLSTDEKFKDKDGVPWFTVETRLGGDDNNTAVNAVGKLNKFDAEKSKYEGLCYAFFSFRQDEEQSIWSGEPDVKVVIRGKKCYDFRSSTVAYTENPAIHMLDYVKSNVYGVGLADSDINYTYFQQVADDADTLETGNIVTTVEGYYDETLGQYVELATETDTVDFNRFTNNTIIDTDVEVFENIKELADSFRGYFPEPDGRLAIASEGQATPVFHFDADNIVSTITRTQSSVSERYNRVIVRFPNIVNDYEFDEVYFPQDGDALYDEWLEDDNYLSLENTITVEHCVYKAAALQLAEVAAKASRNGEQVQFTATFEAIELDVGDVISISDEMRGWINREYRITSLEYRDDALVDISAIVHNDTIYPWSTKDYEERVGGVYLGDPYNPAAPYNLTLQADPTLTTTGTLTWSHAGDGFVRNYRVVINRDGAAVLDIKTQSKSFVVPTLDAGTYEIDVYAVTTLNAQSDEASLALVLSSPVAPDDMNFVVSDWTIEVQPIISSGGVGFGTTFEFDYVFGDGLTHTPQPRFDGASLVASGLIPLTEYTFFARSVNAYGASQWYSESATTTNTGDQTAAQLDPIRDELDSINLLLDDLPEEIGDFSVISGKVDDLEVDVAEINTEIDAAQDAIGVLGDDIGNDINSYVYEITGLHNDWLNRETTRTNEVKQEIENNLLQVQIDGVADSLVSEITAVRVDIDGNASAVNLLRGEVQTIEGNVGAAFTQLNAISTDVEGNAEAVTLLGNEVSTLDGEVSANTTLLLNSELDSNGDTKALIALRGEVQDPATGLSAAFTLAGQAKSEADDAQSSIVTINTRIDDAEGEIIANAGLISQVETDITGNTNAINALTTTVNDPSTGLSATNTLAQSAESKADGNLTSINLLEARVNATEGDISANSSLIQSVETTANNADAAASQAQTAADNAQSDAAEAIAELDDIASDSKVTPVEKLELSREWEDINDAFFKIRTQATTYGISVSTFNTTFSDLRGYVNSILADMTSTTPISRPTFNTRFVDYYAERQNVLNAISLEAKQLADNAQADADANIVAIAALEARVDNNENFAAAQLSLNASYDSSIDSLVARAFLGTNVNGRVTGITIADSGSQQQIIFQSDAVAFTDNAGTPMIYFDTVNGRYVFDGEIIADSGTFSGTVSSANINASNMTGGTITGTTVTGGTLRTAASGARTLIEDDGTYLFWTGSGTKNDTNATFFIKKDGTVYADGSIFSGQIVETNFDTGTLSASVTHNSAGHDVEITVTSNGSVTVIASNAPSPVGVTTYTETLTIKRGSTTLSAQPVVVTRVVEYEAAEQEYTTRDFYSFSDTIVDTGTSSAAYTYTATITDMPLSTSTQKITLKTTENILSS